MNSIRIYLFIEWKIKETMLNKKEEQSKAKRTKWKQANEHFFKTKSVDVESSEYRSYFYACIGIKSPKPKSKTFSGFYSIFSIACNHGKMCFYLYLVQTLASYLQRKEKKKKEKRKKNKEKNKNTLIYLVIRKFQVIFDLNFVYPRSRLFQPALEIEQFLGSFWRS